jgi:hypothetical protein
MPPNRFHKLSKAKLKTIGPKQLFDSLIEHIQKQIDHPSDSFDADRLQQMPVEVQIVYWIWRFECEAGVCGMDKFILDDLGIYAPQIHASLKEVGAHELVRLLETAVSIANHLEAAEFTRLADRSWFDQFPKALDAPELHLLNRRVFELVEELRELTMTFIRQNAKIFFESYVPDKR